MNNFKVEDRDYDLWLLFARTHYHIKRARSKELSQYALSPEQAGILYYIHSCGNNAISLDISRWMLREPQTITSIIDRMVKKGLIKKARDKERKNVIRLSLTDKGEQVFESSNRRESFHQIMSILSEEKRDALRSILNELIDSAKSNIRQIENLPD